MVGLSAVVKLQLIYNWFQSGNFQLLFYKIDFFHQHSQLLHDVKRKEIEDLEFVPGVKFEINDSLKNNGTKYLLTLDDSCEKISNSKAFVDCLTPERHRGLSTV